MGDVTRFVVAAGQEGERLDVAMAQALPDLTRTHARRLIDLGRVTVNGRPGKPALRLESGDSVAVAREAPRPISAVPQAIELSIAYEDRDVIVIDKPAGLTVHPAPGHPDGTLVNALLAHCTDLAGIDAGLRPGIVHRLDKDTTGLLMVAKNDRAQQSLAGQIARHETLKAYLALVRGQPPQSGVIDAPIGRHPAQRRQMAVVAEGRPARTHFRVVADLGRDALVAIVLETGRTHQVRVHFAALGHPVVGDPVYGGGGGGRQLLHAWRLGFRLPSSGRWVEFEAPVPPDMRAAIVAGLGQAESGTVEPALDRVLQLARALVRRMAPLAATLSAGPAPDLRT